MSAAATQHINLYQPIFREQKKLLSARTLVQAGAAVVLGLTLIYGYGRWQLHGLSQALQSAQARQAQAMQQLEALQRAYPARARDQALERELARAREEASGKRRVLAALTDRAPGNATGFSAALEALARQRLEGLWLTGLNIEQGGAQLALSGNALSPEMVPRFLQRLAAEPAFAGTEFRSFRMDRDDANRWVRFSLQTQGGAP